MLDPHQCGLNTDPVKAALREAGALEAAAQVVAAHAPALVDPSPTIQTVRSLWRLHKCGAETTAANCVCVQMLSLLIPLLALVLCCSCSGPHSPPTTHLP